MAAKYNFTTLTPTFSAVTTFAYGINDSGQIVGYYVTSGGVDNAFIDNNGIYTTLFDSSPSSGGGADHGVTAMWAYAINNEGQISGEETYDGGSFGFVFSASNNSNPYTNPENYHIYFTQSNDGVFASKTTGRGINNEGEVVGATVINGGNNPGTGTYGFTLTNVQLKPNSFFTGIHGQASGAQTILQAPSNPKATSTTATGVNDLGQAVGYFVGTDSAQPNVTTAHGFFYNNGTYATLDDPNAVAGTFAEGINNADQIVGYYVDGSAITHGFIFNQPTGTWTTVDVPGASNTFIYGINNNGQLVGDYVNSQGQTLPFLATPPNPDPPAATTAVLIMDQPSSGNYEIYDIGNNSVLAAYPLTQAGSPWQSVHVGGFDGSDTSDLLLRNSSTGAFELFDVSANNASGPVQFGAVGTDWSVLGFGDFSGNPGETDMLMRQSGTAKMEAYDISNNQITGAASMGAVGPEWNFLGVGDFSSNANETDLLMRDSNNGALEVYNVSHNAIVSATGMGAIGVEWSFVGVGDFSGNAGETDMLMRDSNNGALEVYNVHNDQIVGAQAMGAVGLEWSVVGIGDFSGNPGETDMIMRDGNTGAFEIYDISHDSVVSASSIGAVGTDWQTAGIAAYQASAAANAASANSLLDATATDVGQSGGAGAQGFLGLGNNGWLAGSAAEITAPASAIADQTPPLAGSLLQHS